MNIRKRVEQEIENRINNPYYGSSPSLTSQVMTLRDVLTWISEAKVTRKPRFVIPVLQDLKNAFKENGLADKDAELQASMFHAFYGSKNWMVGKNKMHNWKSAVAGWANRNKEKQQNDGRNSNYYQETGSELHRPGQRSESNKPTRI